MNNPDIVAIFIEEAKSSDTITADRAALVLVHMQNPAAVKPLMLAAQSENAFLRQAALDALTSVSELDTAPEFADVLKSTAYPQELRLMAAKSLALIRSSSSLAALDAFTAGGSGGRHMVDVQARRQSVKSIDLARRDNYNKCIYRIGEEKCQRLPKLKFWKGWRLLPIPADWR